MEPDPTGSAPADVTGSAPADAAPADAAPADAAPALPRYDRAESTGPAGGRPIIVTTTEHIPEARVARTIGQVFGLTVRSRSLGGNIAAGLKSLVGGEIGSYVKLNEDARRQAIDRMVRNAATMGANAVVMMRFDSTEMARSMSEIVAYGTAQVVVWDSTSPDVTARRS